MRDLISAAYAKLIVAGIVSIVLPTIPHMDRDLRQHGSRVACPPGLSPPGLIAAALAFAVADAGDQWVGGSFLLQAPLDETAHLLTTLLVFWAIGGVIYDRLLVPALVISVAIDLDHVPGVLGDSFLTAGTPRPYSHSLMTIAVVLGASLLRPRRRVVLFALAVGLAVHFWRDLAEPGTGVALLWPVSDASAGLPHWSYLAVMAVVFMVGLRRSRLLPSDRASRARGRATRRELRSSRPRVAGGQGA